MSRESLTLNTQCRTRDVPIGKRNVGSGTVRLVNQSIPPVSSPGTGNFAIALSSTNVPYPTKTCKNGMKVLYMLMPARLFII